jgi:hypothetical protein
MNITKDTIRNQQNWTNECFRQALLVYYKDVFDMDKAKNSVRNVKDLVNILRGIKSIGSKYNTPELHRLYIKNILKLNTDKLEVIVECNRQGKQRRNPDTIEQILTELLERSLISETREKHETRNNQ